MWLVIRNWTRTVTQTNLIKIIFNHAQFPLGKNKNIAVLMSVTESKENVIST